MKLFQKNKNARGFTIVELLIVIVVIGILASIVIVAYNGVQRRAYNAKMASTVGQYAKILSLYNARFGVYPANIETPDSANNQLTCLDGNPSCWNTTGEPASASKTQTMYTELQKVTSSFPDAKDIVMYYTSARGYYLTYIMSGGGSCPKIGGLRDYSDNPVVHASGNNRCRAGLPDPGL